MLLEACGLFDALNGGAVHPAICERIGYGGAGFGGKTEGLVAIGLIAAMSIPGVRVGIFRRTFKELEGSDGPIDRSQHLYTMAGGSYNKSEHVWTFPGESLDLAPAVRFCHCQFDSSVEDYRSAAFDILLIDQAETFSWYIVDTLISRNRISKYSRIPRPFSVFTANPGGIGHIWFMQVFGIDPDKPLIEVVE